MPDIAAKRARVKRPQPEHARAILAEHGVLRLREIVDAGIAEETIARLVRRGEVIRLTRGLYQLADHKVAAAHSLVEATKQVPRGVICLLSALQYHGLTTQLPSRVWIAIDRNAWKPTVQHPPLRVLRFGGKALTVGVEIHTIEGIAVPIYGVAKTVVDCFRYRNKIGLDVALEALRESLRKRRCAPNELWRLAHELRILSIMKPYLEAMAGDDT
ncbi:MAG: type IV toxin-antitoxin system AbiEi family antitoxin domain-containing protein [Rhodospirillales bacterium]|jgi:predicted transcriptional regulator of viral defense system